MIYYLHPLLAGPIAGWSRHFERCAAMGARQLLIAPPFLTGPSGDLFLTADHHRLHLQLGGEDALAGLCRITAMARDHGLGVILHLVADRISHQSALVRMGIGYQPQSEPDPLPDPRKPPERGFTAALEDANAALPWWQNQLALWQQAGLAGFCCDAAHQTPPWFWRRLIETARQRDRETCFIAWQAGAAPDRPRALAACGFDLATSPENPADRQDWQSNAAGRLITMPEAPFGRRVAATAGLTALPGLPALQWAIAAGATCLIPMGFEYGARIPLSRFGGRPEEFDALAARPNADLRRAIAAAQQQYGDLALAERGQIVSAPGAAVTAFYRPDQGARRVAPGHLVLLNARSDRPGEIDLATLAAQLPGLPQHDGAAIMPVAAGGICRLPVLAVAPVVLPDLAAMAAATAPRIAIENVAPAVDNGRFAVKQIFGENVEVAADIICDGHMSLGAAILWRAMDQNAWNETRMVNTGNDRWVGQFPLQRLGRHVFTIAAWIDLFAGFHERLEKLLAAGQPVELELQEGRDLVARVAEESGNRGLIQLAKRLQSASVAQQRAILSSAETVKLMAVPAARGAMLRCPIKFAVDAERKAAGFASWYEIFPRSQGPSPEQHGSFSDVIARLPLIRDMGYDVLYFPPIHPIGLTNRKGRNNALRAGPGDPGSPYAIGSAEGGHDAIHPELGSLADFRALCLAAAEYGLEIALDFAIQCSPDHPWLREHPQWFSWRADGSIRYAENPPKKYEDIVNCEFYQTGSLPSLWLALRDVVLFWLGEGIKIFRVDNPHTKPLPFWEWLINDVRGRDPEVIFLAEAFTRPKMMYRLAKLGFSQSYSYFTWRNSAAEMREYLTELTTAPVHYFFRPHFFVNTPDINPIFLQSAGRAGFLLRAALAATLSGLWGVYNGFDLCEAAALEGREEYACSEKYQLRQWDYQRPGNIIAEIRKLNQLRRANPALQGLMGLRFLPCGNDMLLAYLKTNATRDNLVLVVVSFDPHHAQQGDIELAIDGMGALRAEDLMRDRGMAWHPRQTIRIDPADLPFGIWRVQSREAS